MDSEITLTLEEELINKMQDLAKLRGKSLSEMIADYFHSIVVLSRTRSPRSPILSEITGILHSRIDKEGGKSNYGKHLVEKYL